MDLRIATVLLVIFMTASAAGAQRLDDFSGFARAIGKEVSVVDRSGLIREGIIEEVSAHTVRLRAGAVTQSLSFADIASAERMEDERSDGAINGLLWGLLLCLMPNQGGGSFKDYSVMVASLVAGGYLIDAASVNRQPIYRAPSAAAATLRISWRF